MVELLIDKQEKTIIRFVISAAHLAPDPLAAKQGRAKVGISQGNTLR